MNKVILSGNLVKDNDLRKTNTGKSVLQNTIAVRRNSKNEKGEYDTDFITLVIWGVQAEYINQYTSKGDKIELVGRWQHRAYQDKEGKTRYVDECVVEDCSILITSKGEKKQEAETTQENNPFVTYDITDEDLPF